MQVERIEDMEVGDFIALPCGEWDTNKAARAAYDTALMRTKLHQGAEPAPQYQIDSGPQPDFKHTLTRIR